ncbi:NmrA family NAD(P)-binding protein [Kribbella deserti]|uniref:NAD(P)H-binding protein n=1 Tax=Kribbella deserti TaxID=1926257 RepID=A0ABV6QIY6_9ACTN
MIVVTTPTGRVGSRVTRLLVQAGERPTVLVRDPARLDPGLLPYVDVEVGDQGDVDFVVGATKGAEALFWVDPPTGDDDPVEGYARMGFSAARAVLSNQIGRTVFLSSVGAEKRKGAGEIDGLGRTEELLDATGAAVLHLRCGYFFTNLLLDLESVREGVLRTTMPLDAVMSWVDPRDIAEIAAVRLLATNWVGRHVQAVHGSEDLSFARVAEILTQVLGRKVAAERITDDQQRDTLRSFGMTEAQVEGIVGMSAGLRDFTPENPRDFLTTTPTTLAAWAQSHLLPAL